QKLRDFLLLYNRLSELCFLRCVSSLSHRLLSLTEEKCLEGCAGKMVEANHRLLRAYLGEMPALLQRR
ncbi:T10B translocase, partial [Turnix velox]|nr:T10B translocase [Turnix velox]